MNPIEICFKAYKELEPSEKLEKVLDTVVAHYYKQFPSDYLTKTKEALPNHTLAKEMINEMVAGEMIKYNSEETIADFDFKRIEKEGQSPQDDKHSYRVILHLTSIVYNCVKIIDDKNFLCCTTDDTELRLLTKDEDSKVYLYPVQMKKGNF